ncbi:hypothetical protein [Sphingomonas sp.]|uniref:hypothetical protein n=1 Tax=Sphingomonas sp. TaxID=28214 RepID=UPI0035C7E36E
MTISQRLDDIRNALGDRSAAAASAAASLTNGETIGLLALVLATAPGVSIATRDHSEVDVRVGRAGHSTIARLGAPDERALIILKDRDVALVSDDPALRSLWGPPLVLETPSLLRGIQYARDDADGYLYAPPGERTNGLLRLAAEWGIPEDVLLALSSSRGEIARVDRLLAA